MISVNEGLAAEQKHTSEASVDGFKPERVSQDRNFELEKTQGILRLITQLQAEGSIGQVANHYVRANNNNGSRNSGNVVNDARNLDDKSRARAPRTLAQKKQPTGKKTRPILLQTRNSLTNLSSPSSRSLTSSVKYMDELKNSWLVSCMAASADLTLMAALLWRGGLRI